MSPTLSVYTLARPASQLGADGGDNDWREQAACVGNGDLFFEPEQEHSSARVRREAAAVDICQACPVAALCLTAALDAEGGAGVQHRFGVVGGMTPQQRTALSRGLPVPKLRRPKPPKVKPPKQPRVDRDPRPRPADCADPSQYTANRHYRNGERPCQACSDAKTQAKRDRAERRAANDTALAPRPDTDCPQPSRAGALVHYRRREKPCAACATANAAWVRQQREGGAA